MKYYNECGICDGRTSDCTFVDQSVRKTNRQAGGNKKKISEAKLEARSEASQQNILNFEF